MKTYTDEELLAAHRLAWPRLGWTDEFRVANMSGIVTDGWDFALGILPEQWRRFDLDEEAGEVVYGLGVSSVVDEYDRGEWIGKIWRTQGGWIRASSIDGVDCDDWLAAVRSGHAATACLLLAAHVDLERRRAEAKP